MGLSDENGVRWNFPIVSFLASPGSGKSYAIQELAANTTFLEEWWNKQSSQSNENKDLSQKFSEFMKNALRVVVTFNNFTNIQPDLDQKDAEIGLCCRILYRFASLFFTEIFFLDRIQTKRSCFVTSLNNSILKDNWNAFGAYFGPLLKERKIDLDAIFRFLWQISNNRPIFLLVDEIGKSNFEVLMPKLNILRAANAEKFLAFYSALNPDYLRDQVMSTKLNFTAATGSSRPIWFVPLFRRNIEDIEPLFLDRIEELKLKLSDKESKRLKRYIAFCNGHMRTLEALYNVFLSHTNLANMEFHSVAQQTMLKLHKMTGSIPIINAEDAKIAILGKEVNKNSLISSIPNTTYLDAIVLGYYFNSEDDLASQPYFVPRLTPFALYRVCASSFFLSS